MKINKIIRKNENKLLKSIIFLDEVISLTPEEFIKIQSLDDAVAIAEEKVNVKESSSPEILALLGGITVYESEDHWESNASEELINLRQARQNLNKWLSSFADIKLESLNIIQRKCRYYGVKF